MNLNWSNKTLLLIHLYQPPKTWGCYNSLAPQKKHHSRCQGAANWGPKWPWSCLRWSLSQPVGHNSRHLGPSPFPRDSEAHDVVFASEQKWQEPLVTLSFGEEVREKRTLKKESHGICLLGSPPSLTHSHHQDYYIFRIGNPTLNLYLRLSSWVGGM